LTPRPSLIATFFFSESFFLFAKTKDVRRLMHLEIMLMSLNNDPHTTRRRPHIRGAQIKYTVKSNRDEPLDVILIIVAHALRKFLYITKPMETVILNVFSI
jgi:hypothetical protein